VPVLFAMTPDGPPRQVITRQLNRIDPDLRGDELNQLSRKLLGGPGASHLKLKETSETVRTKPRRTGLVRQEIAIGRQKGPQTDRLLRIHLPTHPHRSSAQRTRPCRSPGSGRVT
jgi:hypothetical protein